MSISIVACPKCGTFLLNDTAQCHRCRHVIHAAQADSFRDTVLPTDSAIQQDLERCKQCGETYRKGLVRCWSCGAFTRPDIEEAYYRLLKGHNRASLEKYELPEISAEEARRRFRDDDDKHPTAAAARDADSGAGDEEFELEGDFQLLEESPEPAAVTDAAGLEKTVIEGSGPSIDVTDSQNMLEIVPADDAESYALSKSIPVPEAQSSKVKEKESEPEDDAELLLKAAQQEETETKKARRARKGEGFVIYCPMGCKIRVQERHRGKIGRCPKCRSSFVVPLATRTAVSGSMPPGSSEMAIPQAESGGALDQVKYSEWMQDIHLHRVDPQKLRIKPDSLLKEFIEVDLGFDPEGLVLVGLPIAGGGMFAGKNAKKKDEPRAAVVTHFQTNGTLAGLTAPFKQEIAADAVPQLALAQPTPPGVESLIGDIPVFGVGRYAVRLPKFDDKTTAYLSFSLSEFREFAQWLSDIYGIADFGKDCGIPLTDEYQTTGCQVSKALVKDLQNVTPYLKDPAFQLQVTGYRCKVCGAVVSEEARATLKLGGANGKGMAKAKCPKCTKPMGNHPLYFVASSPQTTRANAAPAGDEVEGAELTEAAAI